MIIIHKGTLPRELWRGECSNCGTIFDAEKLIIFNMISISTVVFVSVRCVSEQLDLILKGLSMIFRTHRLALFGRGRGS